MAARDYALATFPGEDPGESAAEGGLSPIRRMVVRQCPVNQVLEALCLHIAACDRQAIAFFLLDDEGWSIAAQVSLAAGEAFAAIDPEGLSETLLTGEWVAKDGPAQAFAGGWARHLYSGVGELLGMVAGAGKGAAAPGGAYAGRIESVCQLAILAIEQRNLLAELAFKTVCGISHELSASQAVERDGGNYRELSMQRIAQMIARQCEPSEILAALCRHLGEAREEQQVAFFLTDGERWSLAARGDLTHESETALASFSPAHLSEELFLHDAATEDHAQSPFDRGWARHLYSGTGELLGMLVGLAEGPVVPQGPLAIHIESACRLSTLALEQRNLVEELAFKAEHDSLTGLYNRIYLERMLNWRLQASGPAGQRPALLYINLDRFRLVNDVLGHATGNRLLNGVSRRFESGLRTTDVLACMGGDEFAILIADAAAIEDAGALGERLLQSLKAPFSIDGHELFIGASIGIGWAGPESTPESLEREAYLALRQAKQSGSSSLAYFHSSMAATPPERLEMEKRLHFALARKELLVYYQPQWDIASGRVTGAEALMRWAPQGLGIVSPAAFVPILEETGMIVEFGRWILTEACRQGKEWIDRTGLRLRMGVNVAASQLVLPSFVQEVQQALLETGFPPELLELELTESAFVGDFEAAAHTFHTLQSSAGVTFALDDFGTGQSSLSYLHSLPFQRLKIDQSFIRRIKDEQESEPLLETILRMAEDLGMDAIAEGVETAHQLDLLRGLGCQEAQGYLFSRPLPAADFLEFCEKHSALAS